LILGASTQTVTVSHSNNHKPISGKNLTGVQYFWDIMPPTVQFLLLNQTQVTSLGFNTTQQVKLSVSNLNWATLPANVQSFLLSQQGSLLNLRFEQWAWTNSNESFSNATLLSLFQPKYQAILLNASSIMAPLKYNLQVDLNQLNQTLYSVNTNKKPRGNLVNSFFSTFFGYFEDIFENASYTYSNGMNRYLNSAGKVFSSSLSKVVTYLKSLGIKAKF
jgi:hypothetical protein